MRRERIFFDSQIYSRAADGRIDTEKLRKTLRPHKYLCVLSPITLYELLNGIANSHTNKEFEKGQRALRLAWKFGGKNILHFPGRFIAKSIFGVQVGGRFSPSNFRKWHEVAIRARDRQQLINGKVSWPSATSKRETFGLDLNIIQNHVYQGRTIHTQQISGYLSQIKPDYLQLRQSGAQTLLSPGELSHLDRVLASEELRRDFVEAVRKNIDLQANPKALSKSVAEVVSALDAVFSHKKHILRQALTTEYNFERDANAYHDMQQLFYLSDPLFLFVTEDEPLRYAIRNSSQVGQVITFGEFLARTMT